MKFQRVDFTPGGFAPCRQGRESTRLEVEIRAAHQRTRETCGPERL